MKYYRRMQYEVETGEEECIVMLDSDGEGRQLEGFDASDSYTTPEFRNWWRLTVRRRKKTFSVTPTETRVRCNLHEFNELVGPNRAFDGSATEASRIFPAVLQRQRVCQNRRFYQRQRQYSEQVQPG